MNKETKIAKICWEARKAMRLWDADAPIKKWSSAYTADKKPVIDSIKKYINDGSVPELKDWTREEIQLLCKITDYLKTIVF
jgi:hypothetical protein